jgi:release factor glutamine methyltransferase
MRDRQDRGVDDAAEPTWAALRADATRRLESGRLESGRREHAAQEARWMVEEVSGARGADLVGIELEAATSIGAKRVAAMVARRLAGEPLQYVLGAWSFRGIDLFVDRRVLIPRPETEVTARLAIDEAMRLGVRRGRRAPFSGTEAACVVADLGTGSGALALALASDLPDAEVWATDVSAAALAVARANFAGAGTIAARVRVGEGDWFDALPGGLRGGLRVVVSNPPYVAEREVAELPAEVSDYEPRGALVSGSTGLESIERIVADAPAWLEPRGALVIELDPRRADAAVGLAQDAGFVEVRVERDLADRPRVLVARLG